MRLKLLVLVAAFATTLAVAPVAQASPASKAAAPRVADVFRTIPVSGTLSEGRTFTGTLDIQRFAVVNGRLVARGTLNGVVKNAAGAVVREITNQAVTLPITQANGSCRILHLELGPLDLDILGLRIQLSRVVLDITAHPGPGNLLGNLLCSIARLLDRNGPLAGVANKLNQLLRLSQLLSNVPVTGTLTGNRTFTGTLDIQRFAVVNGRLVARGTLSGVVKNAAGEVVREITNQAVTLPITQANGTCRILRLELGPLDLDILGLRIQLNRVVLDITARRGPGNLLGNLLCSIARLLDRDGPLTAVANQLNRLLLLRLAR